MEMTVICLLFSKS